MGQGGVHPVKQFILPLLILWAWGCPAQLVLTNNERIAFTGDSITDLKSFYAGYLESALVLRHPELQLHIRQMGFSGDYIMDNYNASHDYIANYDRFVSPLQAGLVTILMTPNGNHTSNQFYQALTFILTNKMAGYCAGDTNFFGCTNCNVSPPSYTFAYTNYRGAIPIFFGAEHEDTATALGVPAQDQDRSSAHALVAQTVGAQFCDLYQVAGGRIAANFRSPQSAEPYQVFGHGDTIHPGPAGGFGMAYCLLAALGEATGTNGIISAVYIDCAHNSSLATNCTVGSLSTTATSASFTRLDKRLPMASDGNGTIGATYFTGIDTRSGAYGMFPEILTQLNQYMIGFSNLTDGSYTLSENGVVVTNFTTSGGVYILNMAAFTNGPNYDQRCLVLNDIRAKQGWSQGVNASGDFTILNPQQGVARYNSFCTSSWNAGLRDAALFNAVNKYDQGNLDSKVTDILDVTIHNDAQPVTRTFTLAPSGAPPVTPVGPIAVSGNVVISGNAGSQ
jgi:hypothetical protein